MYADFYRVSKTAGEQTHLSPIIIDQTLGEVDDALLPGSTTNFTSDEANVSVAKIASPIDIGSMFSPNVQTYTQQDIQEFLRKPQVVLSGAFTTADSGILSNTNVHDLLRTNTIWNNKIAGHLAIRADLHLKLVVNGNRFQQGRYCMAWFPTVGASINTVQATSWYNLHVATLCQRTQLPHVELDINRDTECSMIVPFISSQSHKLINSATYSNPGTVMIFPYSALVAPTGSLTATYTLYAHFENVSLHAPTAPQSSVKFKTTPQRAEQRAANIGPIESTAVKVSKAAGILMQVPLLSSIAAPVSWFSDIVAGVAGVFGWANPIDLSEVTRAVQTIVPYSNNVDMADGSMPLALFARNEIELLPGLGGTDIDETSIDHVKTIPAYFATFNLSTSNIAGTSVYSKSVDYGSYTTTFTDNARTLYAFAPLSYLSTFFTQARGGLVFKFKIVSTEFHSGRYAICFTPFDNDSGSTTFSYATSSYVHREIIDLRMGCEFTFTVPYVSVSPYRNLSSTAYTVNEAFGNLSVYPINPLTAPATVSSTCAVLVEVSGGPDLEFACLRTNGFTISSASAPQSSVTFVKSNNEIVSGDIGNSQIVSDNMMSSRHCVGEKLLSLTSLLKHSNEILPITQGTTAIACTIDPFVIYTEAFVGAVNSDAPFKMDLYAAFVSMYALSRGSVRWRIFNNSNISANSSERTTATIEYDFTSTTATGIVEYVTPITSKRFTLNVTQNQIYRGCVEVQTPPYNNTFARCNAASLVGSGTLLQDRTKPSVNNMLLNVNTSTANGNLYRRQVADDFQMACFISCPTMRIS